jgi:hypothetical protein
MPDIFDFITTRNEVQEPLKDIGNLPDLKAVPQVSLIPTVPANYRISSDANQSKNNPE